MKGKMRLASRPESLNVVDGQGKASTHSPPSRQRHTEQDGAEMKRREGVGRIWKVSSLDSRTRRDGWKPRRTFRSTTTRCNIKLDTHQANIPRGEISCRVRLRMENDNKIRIKSIVEAGTV